MTHPPELLAAFPFLASVPPEVLVGALVLLATWSSIIKGFALWHAARRSQPFWFVALLLVNSLGILEVVYLLAFRKRKPVSASALA